MFVTETNHRKLYFANHLCEIHAYMNFELLARVFSNFKFNFPCAVALRKRLFATVSHMLHFTQYYSRIGSSSRFNFRANASPRSSQETCYKPILRASAWQRSRLSCARSSQEKNAPRPSSHFCSPPVHFTY